MSTGRLGAGDTAIQPTIFDAKGDLLTATAGDTPARIAIGSNGETLVADSSTSTGLRWQGFFAAGKNKIINGDFNINQRAFSSTTTSDSYGFDRWFAPLNDGTCTYSAQTFTSGAAPVAGYESANFARIVTTGQTLASARAALTQRMEDVRTFAGQTVTVSFWAKAATGTPSIAIEFAQNFGSGGSPSASVSAIGAVKVAITTSWVRYSSTISIPSISGKTIGTTANTSFLQLALYVSAGTDYNARTGSLGIQTGTFDIWGVQVEAGSVATPFTTATGTLAGELAACQRYYFELADGLQQVGFGRRSNATTLVYSVPVTTTMRTSPSVTYTGTVLYEGGGAASSGTLSAPSVSLNRANIIVLTATTSGTPASGEAYIVDSGKHTFSAELQEI